LRRGVDDSAPPRHNPRFIAAGTVFDTSLMAQSQTSTLRADLLGGLVSSALAIPLAIGFGMFAFVPLGDEYFAYGAVAGLVSALIAGLVCVLLGERSTLVYAPRITTTFFLGLVLYSLVHSDNAMPNVSATLLAFFAIVLLGGVFQALFGLLRLGTLIKFAPHPVMAGFQNMAALLLFLVQLGNVLGYDRVIGFAHVHEHLAEVRPLSVLVALVTFIATWNARRLTTKVPPLLVGLGIGIAAYYGLVFAGFAQQLGSVIGPLTASAAMRSVLVDFSPLAMAEPLARSLPVIVSGALALAIIASIDALLCAKLAAAPGELRSDGDRLLVRLGVSSAVAGAFGGITNGINIGPSVTNRAFGGRTWISVIVNALMLLAAATALFPLVTYMPRAVLSAAIMVIAVQHLDPWSKQATAQLFDRGTPRRGAVALDLAVALSVSVLSIAVHVVLAVFIGIALAVFLFVLRMSRSSVRRIYRCDLVRSRKSRGAAEMAALEAKGAAILVIELQGALFFGSAERLAQTIARDTAAGTSAVLLDLRRVTDVDSTGARILGDIDQALARQDIRLGVVVSGGGAAPELFSARERAFPDIDRAIEWAEDALLGGAAASTPSDEIGLERVSILRDFAPDDIAALQRHLQRIAWPPGHVVFRQGDPGTALFLVTRGRASVQISRGDTTIRLVTFVPGTVFGELAILDGGPRAATIIADEDMIAYSLSSEEFADLREKEPALAIKLLAALGRELSFRLRSANLTIQQLEM
jgi:sulfate permease, SulP family